MSGLECLSATSGALRCMAAQLASSRQSMMATPRTVHPLIRFASQEPLSAGAGRRRHHGPRLGRGALRGLRVWLRRRVRVRRRARGGHRRRHRLWRGARAGRAGRHRLPGHQLAQQRRQRHVCGCAAPPSAAERTAARDEALHTVSAECNSLARDCPTWCQVMRCLVGQEEDLAGFVAYKLQDWLVSKGVHMLRAVWVQACAACAIDTALAYGWLSAFFEAALVAGRRGARVGCKAAGGAAGLCALTAARAGPPGRPRGHHHARGPAFCAAGCGTDRASASLCACAAVSRLRTVCRPPAVSMSAMADLRLCGGVPPPSAPGRQASSLSMCLVAAW